MYGIGLAVVGVSVNWHMIVMINLLKLENMNISHWLQSFCYSLAGKTDQLIDYISS